MGPERGHEVLVVDDDPEIRHALRFQLKHESYTVDEAANGQYALDYPRTSPPAHGGVAHVRMPGVTGVVVIV